MKQIIIGYDEYIKEKDSKLGDGIENGIAICSDIVRRFKANESMESVLSNSFAYQNYRFFRENFVDDFIKLLFKEEANK